MLNDLLAIGPAVTFGICFACSLIGFVFVLAKVPKTKGPPARGHRSLMARPARSHCADDRAVNLPAPIARHRRVGGEHDVAIAPGAFRWHALLALFSVGLAVVAPSRASEAAMAAPRYVALRPTGAESSPAVPTLVRYGVPFRRVPFPLSSGGAVTVHVGGLVRRIYLLGLTHTGENRPPLWPDPHDYSRQFFIGDELGRIHIAYADGTTAIYPLILGESIWWGRLFYDNPEPYTSDARFRGALAASLRLYPAAPVADGDYVAVIDPKPMPIRTLTIEDAATKFGVPRIDAITAEPAGHGAMRGEELTSPTSPTAEFARWADSHALETEDAARASAGVPLEALRHALYTAADDFVHPVASVIPPDYAGPMVSFGGPVEATILANAFRDNVQDMVAKVGPDGMYHTSTLGAPNWGRYVGFGTFRDGLGRYYDESWARDLGRSLQELTELGYTAGARRCADYCLRLARRWADGSPALRMKGVVLPPHWSRIINKPSLAQGPLENDGHALIALFLYKLWQRLPDRDAWLRARWPDVQAAGDWIPWQFAHPAVTGATDVLHTLSECAAMDGYSVYADAACMEALRALAVMADSVGKTESARLWRATADRMQAAIGRRYVVNDPTFGPIWTLASSGWSHHSSVLGPLLFRADTTGFAPADDLPAWRSLNVAAYRRLVASYQPFGFYGQGMGYGQGFVTQAALLLDRMEDATTMLKWMAREVYDPRTGSCIVPEGCLIDPTGQYWYRIGDLGNGVQEAEIVKALRLIIGVDDTRPERPQLFPRLPYGWTRLSVAGYPMLVRSDGVLTATHVHYDLERTSGGMVLHINAESALGRTAIRIGPFRQAPDPATVRLDGARVVAAIEYSGDSWWVRIDADVGRRVRAVEVGGN